MKPKEQPLINRTTYVVFIVDLLQRPTTNRRDNDPLETLKGKHMKTDNQLKKQLLTLAKEGKPKPQPNSELGKALKRFTTKRKETKKEKDEREAQNIQQEYDAYEQGCIWIESLMDMKKPKTTTLP